MHHDACVNRPRTLESLSARIGAMLAIVAGTTASVGQTFEDAPAQPAASEPTLIPARN